MSAYFGACDSAGVASGSSLNSDNGICFWHTYTCPGSGSQTLQTLGAYCHKESGGNAYVRVGIYNSAGTTLIAQTSGMAITVNDSVDSWLEEAVSATLTGGTDYIIAWAAHPSVDVYCDHVDETRSDAAYKYIDYSAGLPSSLPTPDDDYYMYAVRAKVEAAGGGQIARPVSDVSVGNWTASSGTDRYAMVDEETASDTDYITSGAAPANDACVLALGALSTPVAGTVTLRVRAKYV
jgi:hypothetical protein